ncbi:ROK family glucokinase [Anaeromicropila herbilytica]|uniref:Glucokinase n=1 Tax=Anaeromicropila herbilytica TaxID=2785025 RepID=A0A7R7EPC9_9FIRM|nr:ROK family glucokinase [Anaeromicropila herbilytica]BCN32533.1 glucokinase [Anaeromicropila herbilytica]
MEQLCFGVDIGGTTVKIGLFQMDGSVIDKWEIPTRKEENGRYILEDVKNSLNSKLAEKNYSKDQVEGVGIGVPGPVTSDGTVLKCVNLGWDVFNVEEEFGKLTELKVKAGNDANVAALGEMWQGGGKGYHNMVLVTLGTGVGGGIILDDKILDGSRGAAGEIGHITVDYDEKDACNCGKRGCLEQYASATGIVKEANRLLASTDKASAIRNNPSLTAKDIFDAAKEGDELSLELVEKLGRHLGLALSHVSAVVDPECFVIGGGVSKAGEILTEVIKKHYEQNVMFALKNKEFKLALLGNDAGIYGAARLVLDK